jgi:O-antigen/teichoic acid export membrane protein
MRMRAARLFTGDFRIGRRETSYVLLMGLAVVFSFLRSIVFGAGLGPEQMGYYAVATSVASYGVFLQVGLMNGLNRELPVRLGAGDHKIVANLIGETTTAVVGAQCIGFMLYLLVIALVPFENPTMKEAFVFGGLLALSMPLLQMVYLRLRASQRIVEFSALQATVALLTVALGYYTIPPLGYRGPILVIILINVVGYATMTVSWLERANYRYFNRKDVAYLIRIGAPLMLAGIVATLVIGMDRLFMIKYGTPADVGIYQVASMPITFGVLVSGIVGQYFGPKLLFGYGEDKDLGVVYRKALAASLGLIALMMLASPMVTPVARFVFTRWLPEYVDGLPFVLVFYVSGVLIAANISGIVVIAANRPVSLLIGSVGVMLVGFGLYLTISRLALPIIWYAYANALLQLLNFVVGLALAYRSARYRDSRVEHSF